METFPSLKRIDIRPWTIFSILDPEFLSTLRLVAVFGSLGNEAIVVTQDDDVWALGSNASGCLGLGDMNSSLFPRKVDAISGKV